MIESPRSLLTIWSRLVASSLVSAGVREVVVSPGSRSTPFVLALRARPELELVSVIDERSAAFVALGMARASRRPTAVLATSGTAPAHWLPAVIEASLAQVPLLLLSADRPLALTHAGAAQTIDQTKLFGSWVRHFEDLGDPRADQGALVGVSRSIAQAVAATGGSAPGPVHVNLRADKPLEPVEPSADERALADAAETLVARGTTRIGHATVGADVETARALAAALAEAKRPLVIAGPRREESDRFVLLEACARARAPVAAEATSQLRFGPRTGAFLDAYETILASAPFLREAMPDLIVQIGGLPTAPTLERALTGARRFVLDAGGAYDPIGNAEAISCAPAGLTMELAVPRLASFARDEAWLAKLARAEELAWREVERIVARDEGEGACVRAALEGSEGALLVVGNSLPIRTIDRFVRGGGAARTVLSQRGANGIDGLVSGALGAAITSERPVVAIVGDVSFVHDLNALVSARAVRQPLVVVVIDNGGGRIFETLPIAGTPSGREAMPLFTTPHEIDLASIVRAMGVACTETRRASETRAAVAGAIAGRGVHVVRAIVDPDDATRSFRALSSAIADSLAEIGA